MMDNIGWVREAKAWLKRKSGPGEIVHILPDLEYNGSVSRFKLYTAFDGGPDLLGYILFDAQGYWIYDGDILTITEQEQLAKFIISHFEVLAAKR